MRRSTRLFEIIQLLRASRRPMTARMLAEAVEVTPRTIYRDIAALQAMGTPIEGEAGIGYLMRSGYDLPPLNFDGEELEALRVGLSLLERTGDGALQQAARRITTKIEALNQPLDWLKVAPWGVPQDDPDRGCVPIALYRQVIRDERKLRIIYRNGADEETTRVLRPLALIYHVDCNMLAAWCELRGAFRHFRTDRIYHAEPLEAQFQCEGPGLRKLWQDQTGGWP